jgi:hypothetical protein
MFEASHELPSSPLVSMTAMRGCLPACIDLAALMHRNKIEGVTDRKGEQRSLSKCYKVVSCYNDKANLGPHIFGKQLK